MVAELGELTFESAFRQLEETVSLLESGDLSIDDMLAKFQRGMALVLQCRQRLDSAQARVSVLAKEVEELNLDEGPDEDDDP